MDMPLIDRCFGIFPPKYACFLISIFGLGSGGCGIAGIVLYGVVENYVLSFFAGSPKKADASLKKFILITIGISSLLLTVASALLFFGVSASSRGFVGACKWLLFVMCMLLIAECIGLPTSCFFLKDTCLIKNLPIVGVTIFYMLETVFIEIWLYFMVIVYNLEQEL